MPAEAELPHLMEQLPKWRREQALRFKHYLGQRNCTLSFLLLQKGLAPLLLPQSGESANQTGIHLVEPFELFEPFEPLEPFAYGEHGKPYLPEHPDVHFNLSHCRNAVACIIDNVPVGVDVEDLGRYSESVARYAMSDSEMQEIEHGTLEPLEPLEPTKSQDLVFSRLWTQKEAVLKCLGTGITDNMKDVLLPENTHGIELTTTVYDTFVLSVARKHP